MLKRVIETTDNNLVEVVSFYDRRGHDTDLILDAVSCVIKLDEGCFIPINLPYPTQMVHTLQ